MKLNYSRVLVVDLEATCEENNPDFKNEIIEIGIAEYNVKTGLVENKKSFYIKPKKTEITKYCTKLTGITKELIAKEGTTLEEAVNKIIKEYGSTNKVWVSWGIWDNYFLRKECKEKGVRFPFTYNHIDLQAMFSIYMGIFKRIGIKKALNILKLSFDGKQHSGKNDAYNTAKIFAVLISQNHKERLNQFTQQSIKKLNQINEERL